MPLYIKGEKKLFFFHIPKCAGTSVESILRKKSDTEMLFSKISQGFPCTPQHFHKSMVDTLVDINAISSFAIVRHPLLRMISQYKWQVKKRAIDPEKIDFNEYISKSFSSVRDNAFFGDNHFRPMVDFVDSRTRVFLLERDVSDLEVYLSDFLGEDVSLKSDNRTDILGLNLNISKNSLEIINDFYHKDFLYFSYEKVEGENISFSEVKELPLFQCIEKDNRNLDVVYNNIFNEGELNFKRSSLSNKIWFFWDSGISEAPEVVKVAYNNWKIANPDYEVILLTKSNINDYVGFDIFHALDNASISLGMAGKSDFIRLVLLYFYGGIWVDATTFCLKPLRLWLKTESDFFAFEQPNDCKDRQLVSWFIYSKKESLIIRRLLEESIKYLFKAREKTIKVVDGAPGAGKKSKFYRMKERRSRKKYISARQITKKSFYGRANTGFCYLDYCEAKSHYPYFWMFYLFNEVVKKGYSYETSKKYVQPHDDVEKFLSSFVSKQTYRDDFSVYDERVSILKKNGLI